MSSMIDIEKLKADRDSGRGTDSLRIANTIATTRLRGKLSI